MKRTVCHSALVALIAALLLCSAHAGAAVLDDVAQSVSVLASLSGGEASAAVTEVERKIEETVRDEEERLQQRHPALLGPFAAQAEQLRASAVLARRKLAEKAARGVVGSALLRAPRRALLQNGNGEDNTTEIILIAIFVLIVDFFFGFYTGYLKGFFT